MRRMYRALAIGGTSALLALGAGLAGERADAGELAAASTTSTSGAPACEPIGDGQGTRVNVGLAEWSVDPTPDSVPAGKTTFWAFNKGTEVHELVIVKGDRPADLPVKDGAVDEDALPKDSFTGEIEGVEPGGACPGTFELASGPYILFCNIVEKELNGELESHYEQGMRAAFTVASAAAAAPAPEVGGQAQAATLDTMPRTGSGSRRLLILSGLALAAGGLGVAAGARRPILLRSHRR